MNILKNKFLTLLIGITVTSGLAIADAEYKKSSMNTGDEKEPIVKVKESVTITETTTLPEQPESELSDGAIKAKSAESEKLAKKTRTVRGQVKAMKQVRLPGEGLANLVVQVKTKKANKDLIMDLGNAAAFTGNQITKEAMLTAQGRMVKVGDYQILVVNHLHVGGEHFEIDRSKEMQAYQQASSKTSSQSE